jgi:hypothetical protein
MNKLSSDDSVDFMEIAELGAYDGAIHKDWVLQELIKMVHGWDEDSLLRYLNCAGWKRGVAP